MIPNFDATGLLPKGIYLATWSEITTRYGATAQRQELLKLLRSALINLCNAGCETAYLDGSFVTAKEVPSDFDMCWCSRKSDGTYIDPKKLDPILLDFSRGRAAMKAKYGGDIFIAESTEGGSGKAFLDFFQIDKATGQPKGIIKIDLRGYV
jgi:hypothetical protein